MNKPKINYVVVFFMFLDMLILVFTGFDMHFDYPTKLVRHIHEWASYILVVLLVIHLVLHWNWIVCMTKDIFLSKSKDNDSCA